MRTIGVVLIAMILSGCHHMVPIVAQPSAQPPDVAAALAKVKAEDEVRVTLQNGNRHVVEVAEVRADALLASDGRRFPHADIARLEVRRVAKAKTIALIAAIPPIGLILLGLTWHD
jgi:hypothetical protein